jgi:hypothetical protein
MVREHITQVIRNRRHVAVGLVVAAAILGVGAGVAALVDAGPETGVAGSSPSERAPAPEAAVTSAPARDATVPTATTEATQAPAVPAASASDSTARGSGAAGASNTASRDSGSAGDSATVAAQPAGTTQACRADATCPSSEHRTSDPCGAALIVDGAGYLEGRRDAEQGMAYQVDHAPAPDALDDDDDDATVGPQTRYRAGYVQGWCDGGGDPIAG